MAKLKNIRVSKEEGIKRGSGVLALRFAGDSKDCKSWEEADNEWKENIKASPDRYKEKSEILLQIEDDNGEIVESIFGFNVNKKSLSDFEEGLKAKIIELLKYSIKEYRQHHVCPEHITHAEKTIKLLEVV